MKKEDKENLIKLVKELTDTLSTLKLAMILNVSEASIRRWLKGTVPLPAFRSTLQSLHARYCHGQNH